MSSGNEYYSFLEILTNLYFNTGKENNHIPGEE
jgi:hypothetical protein